MENPCDFDFIRDVPQYDLATLGIGLAKRLHRILVVGLGGGCDVFAAYALARQLACSRPRATILFANTKGYYGEGSKELLGFSKVTDCLWSAPSEVVPLTCDRHGTALERSCPRGPEGSPLLFVLPGRDKDPVRLTQENVRAVVPVLMSMNVDLVVGVDCGGDSLSGGVEGKQNIEAGRDRQMLNCIRASGIPFMHVVLGPGCDGETEEPMMRACCAHLAADGSLQGVFSVQPLFDDMVNRCGTKALHPNRTPNLMWRAHTGDLPSVNAAGADCVCIPRGRRNTKIPREWLVHGLVFNYDGAAPKIERCRPMSLGTPYTMPRVFVTGGQVGADSIPFTVYEELGVKLDGYMPKGFERSGGNGAEIAARHGLKEGEGGHSWRDCKNVDLADAVCAFLKTEPQTGRGTMKTCAYAVDGKYIHVQLDKPADDDFMILKPAVVLCRKAGRAVAAGKPVVVFWDVADDKVDACASILRQFLQEHKPHALMFSGPLERTLPGIERIGAQILRRALNGSSFESEAPVSFRDLGPVEKEVAVLNSSVAEAMPPPEASLGQAVYPTGPAELCEAVSEEATTHGAPKRRWKGRGRGKMQ